MTYGAKHGVPVGARFRNRRSLYDAKVHRDIRLAICGGSEKKRGAESVVLSGACEDDMDLGQIVYYTGIGKRDSSGRLTADQEFSGLNHSLAVNVDSAQPIRLIRAVSGEFEYSGLYVVEDAIIRRGARGFQICQYRMRSLQTAGVHGDDDINPAEAKRALTAHYRLVRDTAVPARVKNLYDYCCQVCGTRIETLSGPYSEGAHLVPLGGGANGPDVDANVLCLCPNHHVMLDHGAICITDDWMVVDRAGAEIKPLRIHPSHHVNIEYVRKHRQLMGFEIPVGTGSRKAAATEIGQRF